MKTRIILFELLFIVFMLILITLQLNKTATGGSEIMVDTELQVNIYNEVLNVEKKQSDIVIKDNKIDGETIKYFADFGIDIYIGEKIDDVSMYDISIFTNSDVTDFEIINIEDQTSLIINQMSSDTVEYMYSFEITETGIGAVMVTPFVEVDTGYLALADLSLSTGDYEMQTTILNEISPTMSNLAYIPIVEYSDIKTVESFDELTIVNKNSCLASDFEPTSRVVPNVAESEYTTADVHTIDEKIATDVESLFTGLNENGLDVLFGSGYRSYQTQESLYGSYVASDGQNEADKYSARPGCSEHQTGYGFDINLAKDDFEELEVLNGTKEAQIIFDTAPEFGFIVRYPEDQTHITQYSYESWHLRYVGVDAAKIIHDNNITLEEYVNNKDYYDQHNID